jgi:sulfite reductase beta subunit-like hemoprotein
MKAIYIGRHRLLDEQKKALESLDISIIQQVENLPSDINQLRQLLRDLRSKAEAIVTVALPIHLIIEIKNANFRVFVFRMNSSTVRDVVEAEAWVAQAPQRRTYLPGRPGEPVRVMEFAAVDEIVEIKIVSKQVYPPQ